MKTGKNFRYSCSKNNYFQYSGFTLIAHENKNEGRRFCPAVFYC
ncbi:MAG: hypothetical protein JWN76_1811 [Chitinophagaceae bacterium]|nr:hypothetical protein [Chitinophagaceae bacterium]